MEKLTKQAGEVEVTQYLRPNGARRKMFALVGEEVAELAEGMSIGAEDLGTGHVAIYVKLKGESDEKELTGIADNGPGDNGPTNVLARLIREKAGCK